MNLQSLKTLAATAGPTFETDFEALHHFAKKPSFASPPSPFSKFVAYCEALPQGIRPNKENERTIARASRYLQLLAQGQSPVSALQASWAAHPTLRP